MTPTAVLVCLLAIAAGTIAAELRAAAILELTDIDLGDDDGLPSWLAASPW